MTRTCSVVILNCVADRSPSFVLHCCVDLNWSSKIRLSVSGSPIGDTERVARCWIRIVGVQSASSSSSLSVASSFLVQSSTDITFRNSVGILDTGFVGIVKDVKAHPFRTAVSRASQPVAVMLGFLPR